MISERDFALLRVLLEQVRSDLSIVEQYLDHLEGEHERLHGLHGRHHVGRDERGEEDPTGRSGADELGTEPLPDRRGEGSADSSGRPGRVDRDAAGRPPLDLPPAARHLVLGQNYVIRNGEHAGIQGELQDIDTSFNNAWGIMHTDNDLVLRVRAHHLELVPGGGVMTTGVWLVWDKTDGALLGAYDNEHSARSHVDAVMGRAESGRGPGGASASVEMVRVMEVFPGLQPLDQYARGWHTAQPAGSEA